MILRTRTVPVAVVALLCLVAVTACKKSKEQLAVENLNRPAPGLVRIMNMSSATLGLRWANMPLDSNLTPQTVSRFRTVGHGKQEVQILLGTDVVAKVPLDVVTKELYTIAVFGSAGNLHTEVVTKEQLRPSATKNLQAFFIDESGKPISGSVEVTNGKDKYTLTDKSGGVLANVGTYEVTGEGLKSAEGAAIEADGAYSLLVVQTADGARHAKLVRNTPSDRPISGGMS